MASERPTSERAANCCVRTSTHVRAFARRVFVSPWNDRNKLRPPVSVASGRGALLHDRPMAGELVRGFMRNPVHREKARYLFRFGVHLLLRQSNIVSRKEHKGHKALVFFAFFVAENHHISLPYL